MPSPDILTTESLFDELRQLINLAPMPGIGELPKCSVTESAVSKLAENTQFSGTLIESALWLLAGELERSHVISQTDDSAEGSFWHGIMHRREGDFGNSKYWFRQVGSHPVHTELAKQIEAQQGSFASDMPVQQLVSSRSLPNALVDACQTAVSGQPMWVGDLERICWWEWQLLFARSLE